MLTWQRIKRSIGKPCWPRAQFGRRYATRVFTPEVDMVSGVGYDNAVEAGPAATRYQQLWRVVSYLVPFGVRA
jgi:hypothetical protein